MCDDPTRVTAEVPQAAMFESLLRWRSDETEVAIFQSLLELAVLEHTVELPEDLVAAVRGPLEGLYELSRDGDGWAEEDPG